MNQLIQVSGSLLVLAAFVAAQRGWWAPTSRAYLLLNVLGSGVLAVEALLGAQWGFLLLEATWAVVSAFGLVQALRARRRPARPTSPADRLAPIR